MMMDSFDILTIASAVFLGNVMTLGVFKGWQRLKSENRFEWFTAFIFVTPLLMMAATLSLAN